MQCFHYENAVMHVNLITSENIPVKLHSLYLLNFKVIDFKY